MAMADPGFKNKQKWYTNGTQWYTHIVCMVHKRYTKGTRYTITQGNKGTRLHKVILHKVIKVQGTQKFPLLAILPEGP